MTIAPITTRPSRVVLCSLAIAAVLCTASPAAADSGPDADSDRRYDRFAVLVEPTLGVTALWRMPASESGRASAGIPVHLGAIWRVSDRTALGAVAGLGLLMGRVGAVGAYAPAGWGRSGVVLTGGVYFGRISMPCDLDEEGCTQHGSTGVGPQMGLGAAYRWPLGDGGWGIRIGAAAEAAWLDAAVAPHSGFYLGVSGLRITLDL